MIIKGGLCSFGRRYNQKIKIFRVNFYVLIDEINKLFVFHDWIKKLTQFHNDLLCLNVADPAKAWSRLQQHQNEPYLSSQCPSQWTGTPEHPVHWRSAGIRPRSEAPAPAGASGSPPRTAAPPHEPPDSEHGPGRSASSGTSPPACPWKGSGACRCSGPAGGSRPAGWTPWWCRSSRSRPLTSGRWRLSAGRWPIALPRSHRWLTAPRLQGKGPFL